MYGSFKDLAQPSKEAPIPQQMIDFFNSTLPEAYEYLRDETNESICSLVPKNGAKLKLSGLKPRLTDRQKKMLGDRGITEKSINELMNNTLEEVELEGNDAVLYLENGQLPFGYLIRTADDNQAANKGRFFVFREPLRRNMPLTRKDVHLNIPLTQKPSDNIDTLNFAGEEGALNAHLHISTSSHTISYGFSFNNSNEPSARKCLIAATIIDGMRTGETVIDGFGAINQNPDKSSEELLAPFWEKVVKVEKALGIAFQTNKALDKATFANIERLHRCIYEKQAVGLGFKPDSITVRTDDEVPDREGTTCRLLFPRQENLNIFGNPFTVYSNVGLEGITLGHPERIDNDSIRIPITYIDNYQCSILYLAANPNKNEGEEDIERVSKILFAPLPERKKY